MPEVTVSRWSRSAFAGVLSTLLVATVACGLPAAPANAPLPTVAPVEVAPRQLEPGMPVPAPTDTPVLSIGGKITQANAPDGLRLDMALLDQLGLVRVEVYEPWVRRELTFEGPWLADVLTLAQPDGTGRSLHLTALDGYQIDLSVDDVMAGGILLATKTGDGQPIPIEDGGPVRIVFLDGVAAGASADQWIWSLSKIDVR